MYSILLHLFYDVIYLLCPTGSCIWFISEQTWGAVWTKSSKTSQINSHLFQSGRPDHNSRWRSRPSPFLEAVPQLKKGIIAIALLYHIIISIFIHNIITITGISVLKFDYYVITSGWIKLSLAVTHHHFVFPPDSWIRSRSRVGRMAVFCPMIRNNIRWRSWRKCYSLLALN